MLLNDSERAKLNLMPVFQQILLVENLKFLRVFFLFKINLNEQRPPPQKKMSEKGLYIT